MKNIALYGAGGHAFAMLSVLDAGAEFRPVVIYDDNPGRKEIMGIPVRPYAENPSAHNVFCVSIGDNKARAAVVRNLQGTFPVLMHPSAVIGLGFESGQGSMILAGAVIDTDVWIGEFTIVNNQATLSHNTVVGDFCHIAIHAAIAGGVRIGSGVLVGAGAVILPGVTIGDGVVIGAGAIVINDVPAGAVVVGNPAKIIRYE